MFKKTMQIIILSNLLIFSGVSRAEPPKISNEVVVNQNGKKINFFSELIKDKKVAINFIYTTCKTVCSPMAASLSGLNNILKKKKEHDYQLISITLDPSSDSPPVLKKFAKKHGQTDGWELITGDEEIVKKLIQSFGEWSPNSENHRPLTIFGNEKTGKWEKVFGIQTPKELEKSFNKLSAK